MLRTKLLYLVGSLTLLTLFISTWGIQAQEATDEVLPERLEMLVYPPTAENSAQLAAVLSQMAPADAQSGPPNFHLPATLLVYQNFDTGNWDVLLNTAAQAKINLTNHPAADIHPRLNRGATHVVFASNRAGNFDLYLMKSDGSNLTRLMASGGDNVNPVWSPDGTKIAFESYRDGQPEIYVMNADGSNQTRLTASPDFDGMPTWSPDGQTIAFSSRRTGGYRIYTMDAATGANQIQRSTYPYSLSPAWSPDGGLIAFTADIYESGWLKGAFLNAINYDEQWMYISPDSNTDYWIRGWSPDAKNILLDIRRYRYEFDPVTNAFAYRLFHAEIGSFSPVNNSITVFNTSEVISFNPDVNTLDISPPLVRAYPLPPLMPANAVFNIAWNTLETGIGLDYQEVQYLRGNFDWTNIADRLPASINQMPYSNPLIPNRTVFFRVRGVDKYFNISEWSNAISTTFYGWYSAGNIRDNRNQPVVNIPVSIGGATLNEAQTDINGNYEVYRTSMDEHTISMSYAGQSLLTPTTLDTQNRLRLPQANLAGIGNLISNSFFENALTSWASTGLVEVNGGYTGQSGATLGQSDLTECANCVTSITQISSPTTTVPSYINDWKLISDRNGNLLILANMWSAQGGKSFFTTYSDQTQQWANWEPAPPNHMPIEWFASNDGYIHFIYSDNGMDFYYIRYHHAQGWFQPEFIFSNAYYYLEDSPKILVDRYGNIRIFVQVHVDENTVVLYDLHRQSNGLWQQNSLHNASVSLKWSVKQFKDDSIHLFYLINGNGSSSGIESIPYVVHKLWDQDSNNWLLIESIYVSFGMHSQWDVKYLPNDDVLYIKTGDDLAFRYNLDEQWTRTTYLDYYSHDADIANTGQLYYREFMPSPSGYNVLIHMLKPFSYQFELIDQAVYEWDEFPSPQVLLDENNNVHYLGILQNTQELLHHGPRTVTAVSDQTHTLAQVVTIPADMPNPTVSLMYRTVRDIPGDDTQFEVWLTNGTVTTTHVLSPTAVLWEHAWFDASEWAGETVTLTLAAVQKAGDPLLRVDLDDVSLGSAAPDTWVTLAAPNAAMPSEELTLTLNYGNLSPDLLAHTTTLTLTLPTGLVVNSISVTPTMQTAEHIIWQLGDLPANTSGTITLTATVNGNVPLWNTIMATAELRTPLAEPSWGNNEHTAALFIGRRAYLPAIFK